MAATIGIKYSNPKSGVYLWFGGMDTTCPLNYFSPAHNCGPWTQAEKAAAVAKWEAKAKNQKPPAPGTGKKH